MKTILIFGASGGVGSCLVKLLNDGSNIVIPVTKKDIDFNSNDSKALIFSLIRSYQPDIIINSSGVLGDNFSDFNNIFDVNLRSNWIISSYFIENPIVSKPVKIIFIGSSAYKRGKKDYILYAASKAALSNLYEGLSSYFEESNIIFGLVNPTRIDTKMIHHLTKNPCLEYLNPNNVAKKIINFISLLKESSIVNIDK